MQIFNTSNINSKNYSVFKLSLIPLSSTNNHKFLMPMCSFNFSNSKIPKQKAYQLQSLRVLLTNPHLIQLIFQNSSSTRKTRGATLDPVPAAKHRLLKDNSNKCSMCKAIIGKLCTSTRNSFSLKIRPGSITHSLLLKNWLSCNNSKSTKNNKGRRWRDIIKQQWWMEHLCQM